jgi:hypothetical protein
VWCQSIESTRTFDIPLHNQGGNKPRKLFNSIANLVCITNKALPVAALANPIIKHKGFSSLEIGGNALHDACL